MGIEDMIGEDSDVETSAQPDFGADEPSEEVSLEDFLKNVGVSADKLSDAASALESWKNGDEGALSSVESAPEPDMPDITSFGLNDAKDEAVKRAKKGKLF